MSSALGDINDRRIVYGGIHCEHGYPRHLCLACKGQDGPKGNL